MLAARFALTGFAAAPRALGVRVSEKRSNTLAAGVSPARPSASDGGPEVLSAARPIVRQHGDESTSPAMTARAFVAARAPAGNMRGRSSVEIATVRPIPAPPDRLTAARPRRPSTRGWIGRARRAVARGLGAAFRVLLVALAAAMGASPRPVRFLRHEDPTAEVRDDEAP